MQKYGDNQEARAFTPQESEVVVKHMQRVGKAVSDFDQDELNSLENDLESVRESEEPSSAQTQEPQESVTNKDESSSARSGSKKKNIQPLNNGS